MRPLRLKMTGFGPYRESNVIDMESLGNGGLYLITGDTGAGKTYIFDAITYALYGDMSGSGRDSKSVRSQYSADGEKTEVELVFEYYGHKYTVVRNPEYSRAKKSGEGFTKQPAGATLIKPDGSVAEGTSKVNEEIRNILGIDKGQFCSIAMIAQGEFRKVLNAGTDERQKLFRKLFNTQPYSSLSDELKELSRKNQEKYNEAIRDISRRLSPVSCSFDETISSELEELKDRSESESAISGEICEVLVSLIDSGKREYDSVSGEISSLEKRLTDLNNTIALARDHRKNAQSLENARRDVPILEEAGRKAKDVLETANGKKPYIEQLKSEASLIEASMASYDELDAIKNELKDFERIQKEKAEDLSAAQNETETLRKKLKDSEALLEEIKSSGEDLIKVRGTIEKTGNRITSLETLIKDIEAASQLGDTLKKQQDDLKPMLTEAENLENEHSRMVSAYMREQAGILADSLKEGEPCPVCGSVSHPHPAELSEDAPSADELEEIKEKAETAREKATVMMGKAQKTKGNLDAVTARTKSSALRETGTEDLQDACESAKAEIGTLNEALLKSKAEEKELKEKAARAEALSASVPELRQSLENSAAKEKEIEKEISDCSVSQAASEARYQHVRKNLAYDSKEDAEKNRSEKAAEAGRLSEDIEKASRAVNESASLIQANDARIRELENVVAGYKPVDEETAVEDKASAEREKEALTEKNILIASELKSAKAALESVKSDAEKLEEIRRKHEIIDSLNRTANGLLTGKERITLESYVQTFYFERIIRRANVRLKMMSDGQYEFVRADGTGDKRHLSGLDLSVLDHYSGTARPVNTLSGGESFMASLSLALGLSDEVQSSAGGIKLDTMFVDEGFGSLDSETLEKAIRTLTELSDEDKLVGIISHVEALKTRIDRQIVVTKDRNKGSRAELII